MRLLIVLFLFASSAIAADSAVDFKGVPFGSRESVFTAKNQQFECGPLARPQDHELGDRLCVNEDAEFGGANATIKAFFYSDSLLAGTVKLNTRDFDRVIEAMRIRFGEPIVIHENVTTKLGLTLANEKVQWHVGTVYIEGRRYGVGIDDALVSYYDESAIEPILRRRNERIKAGAKSL